MTYRDKIFELREQGKSYNEIKEILNCSKGTISYYLGDGQKEKAKFRGIHSKRRMKQRIDEIKSGNPCADCGEFYPPWVMDFDHIDDNKVASVSSLKFLTSLENVLKEIEKCELVCANCHRMRTHSRMLED